MPLKKVLIVDDEVELCELLKHFLVRRNYDVTVCHSLSECEQTIGNQRYDLVFLDNNLPDGTGWDIAPLILEKNPETAFALISAFGPSRPSLPAHTRYTVLEKPLKFSEIEANLTRILG